MAAAPAVVMYFKRVLQSKWLVMVAGMYLMVSAGAAYDFPVYSQSIKASMGLDQKDLNTISLFLGVGDGVGFIAGLLYDLWALPAGVMVVGATLNVLGYMLAWLALTGRLMSKLRVWHFCLFLAVGANAQTFPETAVMVVALRNFPHSRGTVLGLVKGFYGLSGAILPQIYYAIFGNNPVSFLLLAACLPSVVSLLCMFLMRYVDDVDDGDGGHQEQDAATMHWFHGIAISLALYLMVILVVQNVASLSRPVIAGLTSLMILILFLPLVVVFWVEARSPAVRGCHNQITSQQSALSSAVQDSMPKPLETTSSKGHPLQDGDKEKSSKVATGEAVQVEEQLHSPPPLILVSTAHPLHLEGSTPPLPSPNKYRRWIQSCIVAVCSGPALGEDHSIPQALLSLDLWILFLALTCGLGSIMALLNNMAQVGYAWGYSTIKINTLVALVSIWNFFGRIVSGSLSDMFMDRHAGRFSALTSRPALFGISIGALVVANLLIAMGVNGALYIGSILSGLSLGAQYTLTAVIVSELYGLKVLGTIYTVLACAGPLGQYILSIRVAGVLYDEEASKQSNNSSSSSEDGSATICTGQQCFRSTFFIMTGVTVFGLLLCVLLTLRTKAYYRRKALQK